MSRDAASGGQLARRKIDDLEALSRLVQLRDAVAPPLRRGLGRAAVLVAGGVLAAILLVPFGSTRVAAELQVGGVGFTLTADELLTGELKLAGLGVSGLRAIYLPATADRDAEILTAPGGESLQARLSTGVGEGGAAGDLTVAGLFLPAGSRCWLLADGRRPGRLRLSLSDASVDVLVDARRSVRLAVPGRPRIDLEIPSPRTISLQAAGHAVDLDLDFGAAADDGSRLQALQPQLPVSELRFESVRESIVGGRTLVRRVSTVLGGAVFLESIGGQEHRLRQGDFVRFETSSGRLHGLWLEADRLSLDFGGTVSGMVLGTDRRSRMPTRADWLQARQGLGWMFGAALVLLGIADIVFRWWRGR